MPNSSTRSTDAAHPEPACPEQSRRVEGRALVLFSGGQDSTTCLFWAKHPDFGGFDRVEAVGFRYGQKHAVELEQAGQIAEIAGVPFTVLDLDGLLSGSALTEHDKDVNAEHERAPDLPASFVPGRNALFLSVAASFGYTRGITDLVGGMCQTDYSGYPDCRLDFIESMQRSRGRALDTVGGVDVLETVRELSHTDYNGDRSERHDWGYGRLDNPASILRAKGYEEAEAKGWV